MVVFSLSELLNRLFTYYPGKVKHFLISLAQEIAKLLASQINMMDVSLFGLPCFVNSVRGCLYSAPTKEE